MNSTSSLRGERREPQIPQSFTTPSTLVRVAFPPRVFHAKGTGENDSSILLSRVNGNPLRRTGAALTLDEFALWLNLKDLYWSPEGRSSIDAIILFGALLAAGSWGAPLFRSHPKRKS
jgi:hypothetical protein